MITINKVNNKLVKPIDVPKIPKNKIKGNELFEELYANIYLLGKKKSGKSSTIFYILKKCCGENTIVVIFASTVNKDRNWIHIVKWLKENEINHEIFTSIYEEKENHIKNLLEDLTHPDEENKYLQFNDKEENNDKIAPEYIIVFDDLSNEIKDKYIPVLLKKNRHYKMKTIISSQYYNDIPVDGRQNLDYFLLFPGIPQLKLEAVYKDSDIGIPFPIFIKCYEDATKEKYNFLFLDVREDKMRKNFSHEYNWKQ